MAFSSSPMFNLILLCSFLGLAAASSSVFLSGCAVDFENQNYTIITSQCKGPQYPAQHCCSSFKQFACPFSEQINDLTTDCASTMFSYINLYGKYPPGLFANECKEGKDGLDCSSVPPAATASQKDSISESSGQKLMTTATSVSAGAFVVLLFQLLL
ncbi:hypothetical protein CDL15_Pgr023367 [Punica granatum]|uniref:GPI-anchored protein LLG1-like domain-containing protein n=1 Tax=Punica granatum TaxID=22663 RepID=A0A218Y1D9_PUNGR|nr:hypothetical protein CDL15_Pgr023367 [Punica granatum]